MKIFKISFVAALACVSAASSVLAWRQYQELVVLRISTLEQNEPADLSRRVQELERINGELRDQLIARASPGEPMLIETPAARARDAAAGFGRSGREGRGAPAGRRELMDSPQAQALRAVQQKAALDERYAALFRQLNLSPHQLEQFKTLLADRQATLMDVTAAAREQGLDPRRNPEEFRALVAAAEADLDASIKSLLGDAAFAQYQTYEQTAPHRNVVSQLERRLSYSAAPLTTAQADQLVQILAANAPTSANSTTPSALATDSPRTGRGPGGRAGGSDRATSPITSEVIAQAQTILDATQLGALQELQRQQLARQQLRQVVGDRPVSPKQTNRASGPERPVGG